MKKIVPLSLWAMMVMLVGRWTPAHALRMSKVCIEAETAKKVEPNFKIVTTKDKTIGGKGYLAIPGNAGKGKGKAEYTFKITRPGVYYIWARTFWEDGCGNSVGAVIDHQPQVVLGNDGTYDHWHWVTAKRTRFQLKAGEHTLTLLNREDGIRVDQILLVSDKDYVPTRIEKSK